MNRKSFVMVALLAAVFLTYQPAWSQATIATGSIQGTITDPMGGAVVGAQVVISSANAGKTVTVVTNAAGLYNSGTLVPGEYTVRVEAQGFKTIALAIQVQVGSISGGNIQLELGTQSTVVERMRRGARASAAAATSEFFFMSAILNYTAHRRLDSHSRILVKM